MSSEDILEEKPKEEKPKEEKLKEEKIKEENKEVENEREASETSQNDLEEYGEDYGEESSKDILKELHFFKRSKGREWEQPGEYGEGGFFFYAGEAAEYPPVWEKGEESIISEPGSEEEEETEDEKELRREREFLIETIRQRMMNRLLLKRRNSFLQKKLIENFKKRRMFNVLKEEPKGLDIESKYLKLLYTYQEFKNDQENEIEELMTRMGQFESETNVLEEQLGDTLTNFVNRAKEVSLNLISSKTGKKINEKAVDRLLRRQVQKNEEKGRKKLIYIKVKNLIEEHEIQLKALEYFGGGLNIADYEQMKIDNQNFTDKIEEKEDELTKMRLKTQGVVQNLTHVREKTYALEGDIELMEEKVYEVEKQYVEAREKLTKSRKKRDLLREEFNRLKSASGLLTREELLKDFEESIAKAKSLGKKLDKIKKLLNEKKKQENELSKSFSKF